MNPTPRLKLEIAPIIRSAEDLRAMVLRQLPGHSGLARAAQGVADAAREAEQVSRQLSRPVSLHRLPAVFLALALLALVGWVYWRFFHTQTLTIAMPDRDFQELHERIARAGQVRFRQVNIRGSREAAELVNAGKVDLAVVQGGLPLAADLLRLETPNPELALWFLRTNIAAPSQVKRILTSLQDEGSHSVAQKFVEAWQPGHEVRYVHDWKPLSEDDAYQIPAEIDAVFVVKDPADEKTLRAVKRLATAGFRLASPDLGARAGKYEFLKPTTIPAGFLRSEPPFPLDPTPTYSVATYLAARQNLTPRLLAAAGHLLDRASPKISDTGYEPSVGDTSELFQGIEAFLGILINIGLTFLALLGLEMLTYRKRFHELNSLISLISVHQSNKDVLGLSDPVKLKNNLLYLSLCSDLLGLISMIAGYYTQENSSLLFNNQSEIIHQRCDGLKINIQLKVLHATVKLPSDPAPETCPSAVIVTP